MIPIIIWGAGGRMGNRLTRLIQNSPDMFLAGAIETDGHPGVHQDVGQYHQLPEIGINLSLKPGCLPEIDKGVVLDFSLSGGLEKAAIWALDNEWALISGTTALSDSDQLALSAASEVIPVMHAPNFSIGIQLLLKLVETAANVLPEHFDCNLHETHHTRKIDRPSGTALAFKKRIEKGHSQRHLDLAALRGGSVIGEHSIRFISELEEITFSHTAIDRDVFAAGALEAARWILNQRPGNYTLADMLGFH